MKTLLIRSLVAACATVGLLIGGQVHAALMITPSTGTTALPNPTRWETDLKLNTADKIEALVGSSIDLDLIYKQNEGGLEEGLLAGSYETTFSPLNDPDKSGALIHYTGGSIIGGPEIYLHVKDGNHTPINYVFDLTALGWDGLQDIQLTGFWPGGGSISHVTIFSQQGPGGQIPEPASLAIWGLTLGLAGIIGRRRMRRS